MARFVDVFGEVVEVPDEGPVTCARCHDTIEPGEDRLFLENGDDAHVVCPDDEVNE